MPIVEPANDTTVKPVKQTAAPRKTATSAAAKKASPSAPVKVKGPTADGAYTAHTWAAALLQKLGAPVTEANVEAMVAWEAEEGGHWNNTATYNPLNTIEQMQGSTPYEAGKSVQAYTSWEQGLNATVRTLESSGEGYESILAALKDGSDPNAVANAVVNSHWGTKKITIGGHADYGTGAGGSPGSAAAGNNPALADQAPLSTKDYLSQDVDGTYGYLSAFLKNPEIGPILAKAAKNDWSQDRMLAALEKTNWWKKTSSSARSWQATKKLDPASAHQQLTQQIQTIQQLAKSTLGYTLDAKRAKNLANTSIAASWSQAQLQQAIGAEFKYQGAQQTYQGAAGQTVTQLQAIAKSYVVPLSNSTLQQWSKQILEGTYTTSDFQAYVQQQAESLYPTLKAALKSGQTTMQYADPYLQVASQILEKPADTFNLSDPQWNKALLQPGADGTRVPMQLSDWADYLRSLPAYKQTDQAKGAAADFGLAIANIFGKVATPYQGGLGDTAINYGST